MLRAVGISIYLLLFQAIAWWITIDIGVMNMTDRKDKKQDVDNRDSLGRKKSSGHTGPKSQAGKNCIKMNALKHARNAKSKILPYEDIHEYEQLLRDLYEDIKPQGAVEADLVNQYVDSRWRSRRMEDRIRIEQESIFDRVDKQKIGELL
jgi:hypothetical protein